MSILLYFKHLYTELTGVAPLNSEMQLCYFTRVEMKLPQTEYVEKRLRFPFLDLIEACA
jgi:hypothetical protein